MATLKAGNLELHLSYDRYYTFGCYDYCFEPLLAGQPLFNPAINQPFCKQGRYICSEPTSEDTLLYFFTGILKEKQSDTWYNMEPPHIQIKAEPWMEQWQRAMKKNKHQTVLTSGEDGELQSLSYGEAMELFAPIASGFFDLTVLFDPSFFIGETEHLQRAKPAIQFTVGCECLSRFICELEMEHELITKTSRIQD